MSWKITNTTTFCPFTVEVEVNTMVELRSFHHRLKNYDNHSSRTVDVEFEDTLNSLVSKLNQYIVEGNKAALIERLTLTQKEI